MVGFADRMDVHGQMIVFYNGVVTAKQICTPSFLPMMALRYPRYLTDGIRARVETLGPNWAQKRSYMFYFRTTCLLTWSCVGEARTLAQKS